MNWRSVRSLPPTSGGVGRERHAARSALPAAPRPSCSTTAASHAPAAPLGPPQPSAWRCPLPPRSPPPASLRPSRVRRRGIGARRSLSAAAPRERRICSGPWTVPWGAAGRREPLGSRSSTHSALPPSSRQTRVQSGAGYFRSASRVGIGRCSRTFDRVWSVECGDLERVEAAEDRQQHQPQQHERPTAHQQRPHLRAL